MKIKKLKLKNIFIFEDLNLKFKDGLNIIEINNKEINLKLMKILYAMYENDKHIGKINFDLSYTYFKSNAIELINDTINIIDKKPHIEITYNDGGVFTYDLLKYEGNKIELNGLDKFTIDDSNKCIFISYNDDLFNSSKLVENYNEYTNKIDKTNIDLLLNMKKLPKSYIKLEYKIIMHKIINIIDGIPIYKNNKFYIKRKSKEFDLYKENLEVKNLSILYFLIQNNEIQSKDIIILNEPKKYIKYENQYIIDEILELLLKENKQIFINI